MRSDRVIRPGRRKQPVSARPSRAGSAHPLHDFIIPPSDARGRTASITVSLQPAMQRMASVIVEKKSLPFETQNDVWRWCVHQGLGLLSKIVEDKDVTSEYSAIASWTRTESVQLEHLFYERHLKRISESVHKLADAGHMPKALELAELVWRQTDRIADPYWCERYRTMMKRVLDQLRTKERRQGERREESD